MATKRKTKSKDSHTTPSQRKRKGSSFVDELAKSGDLNPDHRKSFDDLVDGVLGIPRKK